MNVCMYVYVGMYARTHTHIYECMSVCLLMEKR